MRASIGYGEPTKENPDLKPWVPDVLRHTAISHYFRATGSYGRTAEQFGNSESIIKKHYQSRVSSKDTKRFYALRPSRPSQRNGVPASSNRPGRRRPRRPMWWHCPCRWRRDGWLRVERGREKAPGAQQGARDFTLRATGRIQLLAWLFPGVLAGEGLSPVRWLRLDSMELMT